MGGEIRLQMEHLVNSNRPKRYQKRWLPPQFAAMALNVFMWTWIRENGAPLPVKSKYRESSLAGVVCTDHGAIYRILRLSLDCTKESPKLSRVKLICQSAQRAIACLRSREFFDDFLAVAQSVNEESPAGYWEAQVESWGDYANIDCTPRLFAALHELPLSDQTRKGMREILERFVLLYYIERMAGTFDDHAEGGLSLDRNVLGLAFAGVLQFLEPQPGHRYRTVRGYGMELLLMPAKAWGASNIYDDDVATHALSWKEGFEPWAKPALYACAMVNQ